MARIVISGTTGSGKSTLAAQAAARLGAEFIELDALHFLPNWVELPPERFREVVDSATRAESWVVAGNYTRVQDLTWGRAERVVWLDYPFLFTGARLLRRTIRRALTRELLWGTNRESFRQSFCSRDSVLLWFLKSYARRRESYPQALAELEARGVEVIRLRSQAEAERWLAGLAA